MKISEFEINQAEGIALINDIYVQDRVLHKGHIINKEDILFLKILGIKKITGIQRGPQDINADNAISIIAAKLCSNNVIYTSPHKNTCKIVADKDGIFVCNDERIAKFNRMSEELVLNIISGYQRVKKGDVIGILEIFSPIVEKQMIDDLLFRLAGNEAMLSLVVEKAEKATIIYTRLYNDDEENKHFTAVLKKLIKSFSGMDINISNEINASHNFSDVADAIEDAVKCNSLVIIIPAAPSNHKMDVIPRALQSFVDSIACYGIPQVNAHDLMIASKRHCKIISIPYNYNKIDCTLIDKFIKMAINKEKITQNDFAHPTNIVLEKQKLSEEEQYKLIRPEAEQNSGANIAAIILAAGISSRARRNKLMINIDGKPMFMKSVEAAIKSNASPVFVITGYQGDEVEEYLDNLDVNVLRNHEYASGVKTSISLGIKSVPSFCDGAILIPADMPNITPEHINKMIKTFAQDKKRPQLCISSYKGSRHNPTIWSSEIFNAADLVPENADMRAIFLEHSDYTKLVEISASECIDVNFPYDIELINEKDHS